jgi:hypothetical protein
MKVGLACCVEDARARVVTGPDHGLTGRVVTAFPGRAVEGGTGDPLVLICVKDEPWHRHVFVPVPCVVILEEGEV